MSFSEIFEQINDDEQTQTAHLPALVSNEEVKKEVTHM